MRLFAAVHPSPEVLDHLETSLSTARGGPATSGTGLRWTPPEGRHITLAFYGEVPEGCLDDLAAALDGVGGAHGSFDAVLRGAGLFDGRTLWIGCAGEGWVPLMAAAARTGVELLGRGEDRRSRPHLTIARVGGRGRGAPGEGRGAGGRGRGGGDRGRGGGGRGHDGRPGDDPAALAHALALYTGPTWRVGEIALVSSHLGGGPGGGPRYDVVHRSALAAVAG